MRGRSAVVISCLLAVASGELIRQRRQVSSSSTSATNASLGQFPWQVGISIDTDDSEVTFCAGAIISERWVLTAASCVDGAAYFNVSAGTLLSYDYDNETYLQTFQTTEYYRHPQYSSRFHDNDIALLHLQDSVVFDDEVAAVQLPSYSMALDSLVGDNVTISGWGWTGNSSQNISQTLQYTTLNVTEDSVCNDYYGSHLHLVISSKICCYTEDSNSTCIGDTGAPLVVKNKAGNWTAVGITSFGTSEGCSQDTPFVFTRVSSFLEFIGATTNITIQQEG